MDIKSRLKCKDLKKQDCVIGDRSGQCNVVWEEHINALELGVLHRVTVKEF